jgi:hypothetical protein
MQDLTTFIRFSGKTLEDFPPKRIKTSVASLRFKALQEPLAAGQQICWQG